MSLTIDAEPVPLRTDADGVVRVSGTRVTLDTVVVAFQQGATAEEIAQQYPALVLSDVYAAIAYYLRHREAVERYLEEGNQQSGATGSTQAANERQQALRDRLRATRSSDG